MKMSQFYVPSSISPEAEEAGEGSSSLAGIIRRRAGQMSRRSQRLSQGGYDIAHEARNNCIVSCKCVVHQPLNVTVNKEWEKAMEARKPYEYCSKPLVSSGEHMLYLYYSEKDDSYHLTVLKTQTDRKNEVFLTVPLEDTTIGDLKYKIKSPTWHQVKVTGNNRPQEFVFELVKGQTANQLTNKVKVILQELENGSVLPGQQDTELALGSKQVLHITKMADPRMQPHLQELVDRLQAAILAGKMEASKQVAEKLAQERVKLNIEVDVEAQEKRKQEHSISVKVHVEDREASGCPVTLKVKPSDTIGDLKKRMFLEYEFPTQVQRWIIGKKIPKDHETLHKCNVRSSDHTLYLYLTTARSVNLDPTMLIDQQTSGRLPLAPEMSGDYMTMRNMPQQVRTAPGPPRQNVSVPSRQQSQLSNISSMSPLTEVAQNPLNEQTMQGRAGSSGSSLGQSRNPAVMGASPGPATNPGQNIPTPMSQEEVFAAHTPTARDKMLPGQPAKEHIMENQGWQCQACTYINKPTRPGCEICGQDRPADYQVPIGYVMSNEELNWLAEQEEQQRLVEEAERRDVQRQREISAENFTQLLALDDRDLIPNTEDFDCPICFDSVSPNQGVVLRECLHMFCRDCLMDAVRLTEEASLQCPYQDDQYTCPAMLQDREIRALVPDDVYARYLQRSLDTAESQAANSYHCKTPDCQGWCIYEDLVNFFSCPVCGKENCLTCKAIHEGMNCRQYQDDLKIRSANDKAAKQTQIMLEKLVSEGEAMNCPQCKVVVQKKDGCDWIKCSICKTEICWVTKGPRWGPQGEGDISGGCGCRVNGAKCDPRCNNCH